eukprot:CFRG5382T1
MFADKLSIYLVTALAAQWGTTLAEVVEITNNVDKGLYTPPMSQYIPLLEDVDAEFVSIAKRAVPAIPYSLDLNGIPRQNKTYPALDGLKQQAFVSLLQHNMPVTLNGITKPASSYLHSSSPLEDYEQFGYFAFASKFQEDPALQTMINESMKTFVDSAHSEDVFMDDLVSIPPLNMPWLLEKITSMNVAKYSEIFPDVDFAEVGSDYYMLDTSIMGSLPPSPSQPQDSTLFSVGAAILLRMQRSPYSSCLRSCDRKLIPTDIKVSMRSNEDSISTPNSRLFSKRTSTDSSWRMALLAARCSFTQWGFAVGHIQALHLIPSVFQRSFYHNLAPDHELRVILEPFARYSVQTHSFLLDGHIILSSLPYNTPYATKNLMPVWTARYGNEPYRDMLPSVYLPKHGLIEEDFTVAQPWDVLPLIKKYLEVENIAADFVDTIITASPYNTDQDVVDDVQLQAMLEHLTSEDGGRLGALVNTSASIQTVKDLRGVLTTYFYILFLHGQARFSTMMLTSQLVPISITSFMSDDFIHHDSTVKNYTKSEFLAHLPNSAIAVETVLAIQFVLASKPYAPLVEDDGNGIVGVSIENIYDTDARAQLSESSLKVLHHGLDKLDTDMLDFIEVSIKDHGFAFADPSTEIQNFPLNMEI